VVEPVFLDEESQLSEEIEILAVNSARLKGVELSYGQWRPCALGSRIAHKPTSEMLALHAAEESAEARFGDHRRRDWKSRGNRRPIGADFVPASADLRPKAVFPVTVQRIAEHDFSKIGS